MPRKYILIAGVVATLLAASILVSVQKTRSEYHRALDAFIAAGGWESVSDVELARASDDENAATLYLEVFPIAEELLNEHGREYGHRLHASLPGSDTDAKPLSAEEIAELLNNMQAAIDTAIEAADRKECVWNPDLFDVDGLWEAEFSWFGPARTLATLLCLRAATHAEQDQWDDANRALRAALRLSDHVGKPPTILTLLVQASMYQSVLQVIEHLYAAAGSQHPSDALRIAVSKIDPRSSAREAILMEGLAATATTESIRAFLDDVYPVPQQSHMWRWNQWADRALYLNMAVHDALLIEKAPLDRQSGFHDEVDETWSVLAAQYYPAVAPFDEVLTMMEILRTHAVIAIDLRAHRIAHNAYPGTWDMPKDPVTGNAMHYERTETGGFILRSDAIFNGEPIVWEWE